MGVRVAVVGGGPGGLMTAYRLQERCTAPVDVTIYEAGRRLGGKILTGTFSSAPVRYEAGAAELYNYSHLGEDPLLDLVQQLGLETKPMAGAMSVLDGRVIRDVEDAGRVLGPAARRALRAFDERAKRWCSPQEYYESDWSESNPDPMSASSFEAELQRVADEGARRFLRSFVHSDLATEPHLTSAAYGLQNYLMNDPAYLTLYTIVGGIEGLVKRLAERLAATVRLRQPVLAVDADVEDCLRVRSQRGTQISDERYDYVVLALPNNYLTSIQWGGSLAAPMQRHHVHYEYPAHYLRVSVLFRTPFWRDYLAESYVMLDAFGGCCLYDESARSECGEYGVLGWLLAGDAAVNANNLPDDELLTAVLDSLPAPLQHGRELFVEGRVHRWIGAVNGLPGGRIALDMQARHIPDPAHPNLLMVGDYLFDSTLNGVLDSAEFVAEYVTEQIELAQRRAEVLQGVNS